MEAFTTKILSVIKQIKGGGNYVVSGSEPIIIPGLIINNALEISFPLAVMQIEALIKQAHKAPFGKGSKTIVDTNVRSVWEIDGDKILFLNPAWDVLIADILKKVKAGLGIEKTEVSASFYKLLIYETGDFFVAHKDSEKEKGMFGTLIIGLPSKHTGGALSVRFDGKEETFGFEDVVSQYQMPFVAFYADCEHEIQKINSGYRVCLTYNLMQKESKNRLQLMESKTYVQQMAALLQQQVQEAPLIILLKHQYTPENFSLESLKHNDRFKADVIMRAAEDAGYFVKLGLFTCYEMGELDGDFYYNNEGPKGGDSEMGEVHEAYTHIQHWAKDGLPALGEMSINEGEVIRDFELKKDDPIATEEEGYMGNYGMTVEYWYHYGAIVLWRKEQHLNLIAKQGIDIKIGWLHYYSGKAWSKEELFFIKSTFSEIRPSELSHWSARELNLDIVADLLVQLNDNEYLQSDEGFALQVKLFDKIYIAHWEKLVGHYGLPAFKKVFSVATENIKLFKHLLELFDHLTTRDNEAYNTFITAMLQELPEFLPMMHLGEKGNRHAELSIVSHTIKLSNYKNHDAHWVTQVVKSMVAGLNRGFVNNVLAEALLLNKDNKQLLLYAAILKVCKHQLRGSIANKPLPPASWSRAIPETFTNKAMLAVISSFVASPTEEFFDYRVNQQVRNEMESAINNSKIDLRTETIRKGSPHTLRLIKTQGSFLRLFKKWEEDVELLERLERIAVAD
ncbi:MAG: hypothetical protein V4722_14765 [Bacteroidota bacterium]